MTKPKPPIFDIAVVSLIFCFLMSVYLFYTAVKSKLAFPSIKGVVESIGNKSSIYPNKNPDKYRYLKLEGFPKPFEIFVGKEAGDFTPALDKLDSIKPGDTLVIYYDDNPLVKNAPVNRMAFFIDRGKEPVFVKGSWGKYIAYFIAAVSVLTLVWVVRLWKKGKIA